MTEGDGDGVPNGADNCPSAANPGQVNTEGTDVGDACDTDDDNDGRTDAGEAAVGSDPKDADSDGDGRLDGPDACPTQGAATGDGCARRRPTIRVVTRPADDGERVSTRRARPPAPRRRPIRGRHGIPPRRRAGRPAARSGAAPGAPRHVVLRHRRRKRATVLTGLRQRRARGTTIPFRCSGRACPVRSARARGASCAGRCAPA